MTGDEYMTAEDIEALDASDVAWKATAAGLHAEVSRLTRELRAQTEHVSMLLVGAGQARVLIADLTERLESLRSGVLQVLHVDPTEDPVCAARFVRESADAFAARVRELAAHPRTWVSGADEDSPAGPDVMLVDAEGVDWWFEPDLGGWVNTEQGDEMVYEWPAALSEARFLRERPEPRE